MKKLIFSTIVLMAFSLSCTNLDETVYDKIPEGLFPENEQQAALALVSTYKELADLIDDAGWWFWAQEIPGDGIVFPVRLTDWDDGGKWRVLHQHAWDNNTDAVNSMWSHMYEGVFEANRALDGLAGSEDDPAAALTIAKLKTLRAFFYYLLIDNYGDVPFVTSFFDADEQPMKEDRLTIWQGIVDDVESSLAELPPSANNFAVSKGMAYMLLAKLYLNAESYGAAPMWVKAEQYCDSIIMGGQYFLQAHPLDPFIAQNENSPENIFTIPFDDVNLKGFRLHMRTLHYQHDATFNMVVGPWNGFATMEDHYNTYDDDDLRKEMFLVGEQLTSTGNAIFDETAEANLVIDPYIPALVMDGAFTFQEIRMSGARVAKYEIEDGADENLSNDFPFFRYADVLLMKAEAVIRQGGNGDMYVNDVRMRAGLDTWAGVTLDMLLEERGREMFCEGHRRQDLIRFGKFTDAWWEKPASTPDRTIFPIPQWAIDANPNLGL